VTAEERRRRLIFSPFPSKYRNLLRHTRDYVYGLVARYCLVLETIGNRKVYFLPKHLAPFFVEAVEEVNQRVLEPLRKDVEKFRGSNEYLRIKQILFKRGVDPRVLDEAPFHIGNYAIDVLPVDFSYSIEGDAVFTRMKATEALRGVDALRAQIERKRREYATKAVSEAVSRIVELAGRLRGVGRGKWLPKKVDELAGMCEDLGMGDVVEKVLKPLREICSAKPHQRKKLSEKYFGTEDVKEGVSKALEGLAR